MLLKQLGGGRRSTTAARPRGGLFGGFRIAKDDNTTVPTILDMSGGSIFVEEKNYSTFLHERAAAILSGKHVDCFSEVVTEPLHHGYVDIEVYIPTDLDDEEVFRRFPFEDLARLIQCFYREDDAIDEDKATLVLTTSPVTTCDDDTKKVGMHLIFSYTKLTIEDEFRIRSSALSTVQDFLDTVVCDAFSLTSVVFDAETVYDSSVYASGKGLRMLRAHKAEFDATVGKKVPIACPKEGRPYSVHSVLDSSGKKNEKSTLMLKNNLMMASRVCSIRISSVATAVAAEVAARKRKHGGVIVRGLTSSMVPEELYEFAALIDEAFRSCHVVDIEQIPNSENLDFSGIKLVLGDFKYCPCKGGEHKTSTLYLFVNVFGVLTARCWSRKHPYWKSKKISLPQRILDALKLIDPTTGVPIAWSFY